MEHVRRDCFSRAARNNAGGSSVKSCSKYEHVHVFPRIVQSRKIEASESTPPPPPLPLLPQSFSSKEIQIEDVLDNVGDYWMN